MAHPSPSPSPVSPTGSHRFTISDYVDLIDQGDASNLAPHPSASPPSMSKTSAHRPLPSPPRTSPAAATQPLQLHNAGPNANTWSTSSRPVPRPLPLTPNSTTSSSTSPVRSMAAHGPSSEPYLLSSGNSSPSTSATSPPPQSLSHTLGYPPKLASPPAIVSPTSLRSPFTSEPKRQMSTVPEHSASSSQAEALSGSALPVAPSISRGLTSSSQTSVATGSSTHTPQRRPTFTPLVDPPTTSRSASGTSIQTPVRRPTFTPLVDPVRRPPVAASASVPQRRPTFTPLVDPPVRRKMSAEPIDESGPSRGGRQPSATSASSSQGNGQPLTPPSGTYTPGLPQPVGTPNGGYSRMGSPPLSDERFESYPTTPGDIHDTLPYTPYNPSSGPQPGQASVYDAEKQTAALSKQEVAVRPVGPRRRSKFVQGLRDLIPKSVPCRLLMLAVLLEAIINICIQANILWRFQAEDLNSMKAQARRIPVYLYIFITAHFVQVALTVYAIRTRNMMQIIALAIFNLMMMVYAIVEISELRTILQSTDMMPIDSDGKPVSNKLLTLPIQVLTILCVCIIAAAEATILLLSYLIWREFGWSLYRYLGADLRIRRYYFRYQLFECIIPFAFFFFAGFGVQFLFLVLNNTKDDPEYILTWVMLPCSLIWLIMGGFAARLEITALMAVFETGLVAGLVYFIFKLVRVHTEKDKYALVKNPLTIFSVLSIIVIVLCFIFGVLVWRNFGKGLREHLRGLNRSSGSDQISLDPSGRPSGSNQMQMDELSRRQQHRLTID